MTDFNEEAVRNDVEKVFGKKSSRPQQQTYTPAAGSSIKHVVGVVSGKGGVGKSMVCGTLAVQLARAGYKVGILDADITGPSIPKMFGLSGVRVLGKDGLLVPAVTATGIKVMSTNLILENENDPVLWRGPMLMGALKQFFEETLWGELDYLLVDMPPGTGDVALTVFQSLPLDGLIMVTSPQDLVEVIVGKAVKMAQMMNVPILGVIENMSYMTCPDCGKRLEPFGPSHLDELVREFNLANLGALPINPSLAASCDKGNFEEVLPADNAHEAVTVLEALA